jgi:hypothetical protein
MARMMEPLSEVSVYAIVVGADDMTLNSATRSRRFESRGRNFFFYIYRKYLSLYIEKLEEMF